MRLLKTYSAKSVTLPHKPESFEVTLVATVSTLSSPNASIIGASRIIIEMASEKQIPGRFTRFKNGQPYDSILLKHPIRDTEPHGSGNKEPYHLK